MSMSSGPCGVLVAGATGTIGVAVCRRLLADGHRLVVGGRDEARLASLVVELRQAFPDAAVSPLVHDLDDDDGAAAAAARAQELDGLDALVCCVGGARKADPHGPEADVYVQAMEAKFFPVVRIVRAVAARMAAAGRRGRVAVVTGIGGRHVLGVHLPGGAANAALNHFVKGFGRIAAADGILLNAVSPGLVRSPRSDRHYATEAALAGTTPEEAKQALVEATALGREGTPEEVAEMLAFLAVGPVTYLVGEVLNLDGGLARDPSR